MQLIQFLYTYNKFYEADKKNGVFNDLSKQKDREYHFDYQVIK